MPVELVVVRHGQTEWSRTGRHTGRTDVPLTEEGRAAAVAVGPALQRWRYAAVLTSPLRRARVTCELAGFGAVAVDEPDLLEWDYGEVEGRTTEELREATGDPAWSVWRDGVFGGEAVDAVGARADRVIERVRAAHGDGDRVLLFAHGHLLRILAARWLGLPASHAQHLLLDPTTISVLGWERTTPALRWWNAPAAVD